MAFSAWIEGESPATGAVAVYRSFVTMLVAAGASKLADSDGTTYSSGGTQVTSGASGANGLANTSAWIRVRLADGREYVLQRGSSNLLWRIKYSKSAGFTGGSPGATRVPSATDETLRWGGGTDASPTYATLFGGADNSYKLFGGADSAAPYGFWVGAIPNGGGTANFAFLHDPVTPASGSDQDPFVNYLGTTWAYSSMGAHNAALTSSRASAWFKYGAGGSDLPVAASYPCYFNAGSVVLWPGGVGSNAHDAKDNPIQCTWARAAAFGTLWGPKGVSTLWMWNPVARSAGETFSAAGTRDRICFGDGSLPWSSAVVNL